MTLVFASLSPAVAAVFGFVVGLALGLFHFATLRKVTALYVAGGSAGRAIALQVARLVLLAAVLAGLALAGAVPLISGAVGLLAGRMIVLRRGRA